MSPVAKEVLPPPHARGPKGHPASANKLAYPPPKASGSAEPWSVMAWGSQVWRVTGVQF